MIIEIGSINYSDPAIEASNISGRAARVYVVSIGNSYQLRCPDQPQLVRVEAAAADLRETISNGKRLISKQGGSCLKRLIPCAKMGSRGDALPKPQQYREKKSKYGNQASAAARPGSGAGSGR